MKLIYSLYYGNPYITATRYTGYVFISTLIKFVWERDVVEEKLWERRVDGCEKGRS